MAETEVKFKFTPEPGKLNSALEDAEKKARGAEAGINKSLSSATKETTSWTNALGGVGKAFGAITAIVGAGKVISFMSDAVDKAQELEDSLEEVEKGSASLGESLTSIQERLDESLEGIGDRVQGTFGNLLLNVKKMVYATFANVAEALNSAFTIKDADKIEESYDKQNASLEKIGDELTRLSAIQKRTAEEELQFLKIKEDMTIQLDKLGMSYTTLAQRTTSYKDAMAEAAKEAKRQAQEQLWAQAQMLRQSAGMTADKFERGVALERLRASGDMRSPRARMMLREAAEDRVNDEKRIKLAKELEAKAINLGKPKPVAATGGGEAGPEAQINEQRFIQTRGRLIQIENDRIDTRRKIKAGQDFEDLSEEKKRQLLNADKEAKILAENEINNLTSNYAQFVEDKWLMEYNFINQQTNAATRASEELFEAKMKLAQQEHEKRIANGKDETESEAQMEAEIESAKESNESRLNKIRLQNIILQAKATTDSFNQTMNAAASIAKATQQIRSGDIAGGTSSIFGGAAGLGKGLSGLGIIEGGGKAAKVLEGFGIAGQVVGAVTGLGTAISGLFGKSDTERQKEAQEQKQRDEEARSILELQANYQKSMLALQEAAAKLPFENLTRQLRLIDIEAQKQTIAGGDTTAIETKRLEDRLNVIQGTLTSQSKTISGGSLFTDVGSTPDELIKFLSDVAAMKNELGPLMSLAGASGSVPLRAMIDMQVQELNRLGYNTQVTATGRTYDIREGVDFQRQRRDAGLDYDASVANIQLTDREKLINAAIQQGIGGQYGWNPLNNLMSEVGIDVGVAENLLSVIEQSNSTQLEIAANTKKTAANTSLQLEKDRNASFIDIAGGGIRGFGQLLTGQYGLNTNALTLPQGLSNAILATQGMKTLEEKSFDALKSILGVNEDMRELLAEIAVNTNRAAGAEVIGSRSETELLQMLDAFKARS